MTSFLYLTFLMLTITNASYPPTPITVDVSEYLRECVDKGFSIKDVSFELGFIHVSKTITNKYTTHRSKR